MAKFRWMLCKWPRRAGEQRLYIYSLYSQHIHKTYICMRIHVHACEYAACRTGMCARHQNHDVEMTMGHAPVASQFVRMAWLGVYHLYRHGVYNICCCPA